MVETVIKIESFKASLANPRQGDIIYIDSDLLSNLPENEKKDFVAHLSWLKEVGVNVATVVQSENDVIDFSEYITILQTTEKSISETLLEHLNGLSGKAKRFHIIADQEAEAIALGKQVNKFFPATLLYHFSLPKLQNQQIQKSDINMLPATLNDYYVPLNDQGEPVSLGGGTDSTFKLISNNNAPPLVFKFGASQDAIKIEMLTNMIYRFLGAKVPMSDAYSNIPATIVDPLNKKKNNITSDGLYQVSEYIAPAKESDENKIKQSAQQFFVLHALLGNIDVSKMANFIYGEDEKIYLIDTGSNYIYRALGETRDESGKLVAEIDTMRNKSFWFGDVTDAMIKQQVRALLDQESTLEQFIWDSANALNIPDHIRMDFISLFSNRIDDLAIRYCPEVPRFAKPDRQLPHNQTAAGVLTYTLKDNEPYVLLAKRRDRDADKHAGVLVGLWDCFGGGTDAEDEYLQHTAAREVFEESSNKVLHAPSGLLNCPFHDIITQKNDKAFIYRMYLREHSYIDPSEFKDKEHSDYKWVKLSALTDSLSKRSVYDVRGLETVTVTYQEGKQKAEELALFPEFYELLKQQNVKAHMHTLSHGKSLKKTHTQSVAHSVQSKQKPKRHFHSPETLTWQAKKSVLDHLLVIAELKERFKALATPEILEPPIEKSPDFESQTELYMRAILGEQYIKGDLKTNVKNMLDRTYAECRIDEISETQKNNLISQCVKMIETERQGLPSQTYVYHAVDDKISFIYDVYSAIYQLLQKDPNWRAFRATNEYFKPFENIEAFKIFFMDSEGKIHNNKDGYNETAISTNWSLFGNYNLAGSNSLYYFLTNHTARDVNLAELLTKVVTASGLPQAFVQPLIQLYEQHYKNESQPMGVLYQLALPSAKMDEFSYPAVSGGDARGYQGIDKLSKLLPALKADLDSDDEAKVKAATRYLESLQARVMVPPHEKFATHFITPQDLDNAPERQIVTPSHKIIQDVLYDILINQTADTLHPNTPAEIILSDVLEKMNIPKNQAVSEMTVKRAVVGNQTNLVIKYLTENPNLRDYAMVQCVLFGKHEIATELMKQYPDFKQKTLAGIKSYISASIPPLPLFYLIAKRGKKQEEMMIACYGKNWMHALPREHTFDTLLLAMKVIPENDRPSYLKKYITDDIIITKQFNNLDLRDDYPFSEIVALLPQTSRKDMFNYLINRPSNNQNAIDEIFINFKSDFDVTERKQIVEDFFATRPQQLPQPYAFRTFLLNDINDANERLNYAKRYADLHPDRLSKKYYVESIGISYLIFDKPYDVQLNYANYILAHQHIGPEAKEEIKKWMRQEVPEIILVRYITEGETHWNFESLFRANPHLLTAQILLDYFSETSQRMTAFDMLMQFYNKPNLTHVLSAFYGNDWLNTMPEENCAIYIAKYIETHKDDLATWSCKAELAKMFGSLNSPRFQTMIIRFQDTIKQVLPAWLQYSLKEVVAHLSQLANQFPEEFKTTLTRRDQWSEILNAIPSNEYTNIFERFSDTFKTLITTEGDLNEIVASIKKPDAVKQVINLLQARFPDLFQSATPYLTAIKNATNMHDKTMFYLFYKGHIENVMHSSPQRLPMLLSGLLDCFSENPLVYRSIKNSWVPSINNQNKVDDFLLLKRHYTLQQILAASGDGFYEAFKNVNDIMQFREKISQEEFLQLFQHRLDKLTQLCTTVTEFVTLRNSFPPDLQSAFLEQMRPHFPTLIASGQYSFENPNRMKHLFDALTLDDCIIILNQHHEFFDQQIKNQGSWMVRAIAAFLQRFPAAIEEKRFKQLDKLSDSFLRHNHFVELLNEAPEYKETLYQIWKGNIIKHIEQLEPYYLVELLKSFDEEKRSDLFRACGLNILRKSPHINERLLSILPPPEFQSALSFYKSFNLRMYSSSSLDLLKSVSDEKRTMIFNTYMDDIISNINRHSELSAYIKLLPLECCKILCDRIGNNFRSIVGTTDFSYFIKQIDDVGKLKLVCDACRDFLFEYFHSIDDYISLINEFDKSETSLQRQAVFDIMKTPVIEVMNQPKDYDLLKATLTPQQLTDLQYEMVDYVNRFEEAFFNLPADDAKQSGFSLGFFKSDLMKNLKEAKDIFEKFYLIKKEIKNPNSKAAQALVVIANNRTAKLG